MAMRFDHKTSYLPVSYKERTNRFLMFKRADLPLEPDVEMFFQGAAATNHMREVEAEGYELVTVQPVLKAVVYKSTEHGPQPHGFAYPLTAGFVLFWRRPAEQAFRD
jgi:hypothetical protein